VIGRRTTTTLTPPLHSADRALRLNPPRERTCTRGSDRCEPFDFEALALSRGDGRTSYRLPFDSMTSMRPGTGRLRAAAGLLCAAAAAVLWTVGLTILQPRNEPAGVGMFEVASNNTYWARDVRFAAIVAVVTGFILSVGGRRPLAWCALGGGIAWAGVDVLLDRLDVAGPTATVWVATIACAVLVVARVVVGLWLPIDCTPDRLGLTVAAVVASATVLSCGVIVTPDHKDHGLVAASMVLGGLLTLTILGSALSAAPTVGRTQILGACAAAVAAAAGLAIVRLGSWTVYANIVWLAFLPGLALLIAVWFLVRDPDHDLSARWEKAAIAAGLAIGVPVVLILVLLWTTFVVNFAAPISALTGSPPVNVADSDTLVTLGGLLVGAVLARWLVRLVRGDIVRAENVERRRSGSSPR
jgi:hypothetical protein